jgi:hypothetical protein
MLGLRRLHIGLADFMGKSKLVKKKGTAQFGIQHEVSQKSPRRIREGLKRVYGCTPLRTQHGKVPDIRSCIDDGLA